MRRRILVVVAVLLLGLVGYFSRMQSKSRVAAETLMDRAFAAGWSSNERSIPMMEEKVKQEPRNARPTAALGLAYLQRARESGDPSFYTKAEALFERALAVDPK